MKNKILSILLFAQFLGISACKNFVEVDPPTNRIVNSTVFLTEETATGAINGLYSQLSNSSLYFAGAGLTVYLGLYSDELYTTSTSANVIEFANTKLFSTNGTVYYNFWAAAYQVIYNTNACIEGLNNSQLAPALKNQLLGEAYFLRAFCYWYLVNLYGDVPLVLTAKDYAGVAKMTRTPVKTVQDKVIEDLGQAKNLLKPAYPTTGRYRVNHYAVEAMLSRVHTVLGNWNEVLINSNDIIAQTGLYGLETDFNKVFLIGSVEAIWQTATANSAYNTYEGFAFIPLTTATARPTYPLQADLNNAFFSADLRKANWIGSKLASGITYYYPLKYKIRSNTVKTEAQMMIRLAEVYLNRAEAKYHLNDPTAINDVNKTRNRAGLSSLSGLTGQALLDAIMLERRLELFAEWGLRWFDLKRTGQLPAVLGPLKSDWVATAALFPIPNGEILAAPQLTQNPGYN